MKTYNVFQGQELKMAEKIQQRRYQLLIHSCLYYELNCSIVSDYKWNSWANELVDLQLQYPHISKSVTLYEYFKDWDASTGAFLPITLPWVLIKAKQLLNIHSMQDHVSIKDRKTTKKRLF